MNRYCGINAVKGQAMAAAAIWKEEVCQIEKIIKVEFKQEEKKLSIARENYDRELRRIEAEARKSSGEDAAKIFKAYQEIVGDNVFFAQVVKRMKKQKCNIEYALQEEMNEAVSLMEKIADPYIRERAEDIRNVCTELQKKMSGKCSLILKGDVEKDYILIAEDLSPADTVKIDKTHLRGFILEKGGKTSHTAILAKTLGIPVIVGAEGIMNHVRAMELIYLNGTTGEIIVEPNEEFLQEYRRIDKRLKKKQEELETVVKEPAVTKDGYEVKICVNAGDSESSKEINTQICDGIGLLRTEFIYMGKQSYPTEEEQFQIYKEFLDKMQGKEVVIRTLDIGGDKQLEYMNLPKESNPFLGFRAIRISLEHTEIFRMQIRALLRASIYGNLSIMFPMIVTVEEVRVAKSLVEEVKSELAKEGIPYDSKVKIGIMIETPAAVLISDQLAKEVDFFSIGTNDLIQYITATDRMNQKVQYLYDNCNISVLRAVAKVIQNAHEQKISVSICGEAASENLLIPLWIGMGIDKLSMPIMMIGEIKKSIREMTKEQTEKLCEKVLQVSTIEEAKKQMKEYGEGYAIN